MEMNPMKKTTTAIRELVAAIEMLGATLRIHHCTLCRHLEVLRRLKSVSAGNTAGLEERARVGGRRGDNTWTPEAFSNARPVLLRGALWARNDCGPKKRR